MSAAGSASRSPEQIGRLMTSAALASVATALVLIVAKTIAWLATDSVSLLASLADSLMDSLASLLNFLAVRYSLQPADDEHRFGHGKAEFLAGLAQAVFIASSAVFLFAHGLDRLMHPQPLADVGPALAVMVLSVVMTAGLLVWQRHVIRATQSVAIKADSLHYFTDLATNTGVIAALLLASTGLLWVDPAFALGFSIYIAYSAVKIGLEAGDHLMDRELSIDVQRDIMDIVRSDPLVRGVHGLRTRQSGHVKVIQMHLELDGEMPLRQAHEIAETIEQKLAEAFPGADVIIHQDPWPLPPDDRH
jgi:ferrous-iron efflux pump FieF